MPTDNESPSNVPVGPNGLRGRRRLSAFGPPPRYREPAPEYIDPFPWGIAEPFHYWVMAYWGTAIAGSVYGLCLAGIFGLLVGAIIALFTGGLVFITAGVLCWALWLQRLRLFWVIAAGAATGFVSTWGLSNVIDLSPVPIFLGGLGALLAGGIHECRQGRTFWPQFGPITLWQFTLRDLFLRMTVLAVLITVWTMLVKGLMGWE